MTAEAPDPKTFGSWEEAFQYPIVTVRNMERQLRSDLETNRGRLRTLVGYWFSSNYWLFEKANRLTIYVRYHF